MFWQGVARTFAMIPAVVGAVSAGVVTFVVVGRERLACGALAALRRLAALQLGLRRCARFLAVLQLVDFRRARADAARARGVESEAATAYCPEPGATGVCGATAALAEAPMVTHATIAAAMAMRIPLRVTLCLSAYDGAH